jgi:dTDP-glucose 4,6-dehydratase
MNKIFISGGAGFIGSHLCEEIFNNYKNAEIIILDKITYAGNLLFLKNIIDSKRVKFIREDILNFKKYEKFIKDSDIAINVAAESHVDRSFKSSLLFTKTNTLGAHTFIQTCFENNVKKIIHVSTDEVYGEIIRGSANESSLLNPTNPYSASKAAAEIIINSYRYFEFNKIITVRGNNIYGKRQYPEKLIPCCILNLLFNKKILINGDGSHLRCFLSVNDFVDGILLLIKKKVNGIYNIGNETYYRNLDIAKIICEFLEKDYKKNIKFIKDRPFNDRRYSIKTDKLKKLGWKPKKKLIEDLPEIINWYKKNLKIFNKNR